jgi:hypothetical protein
MNNTTFNGLPVKTQYKFTKLTLVAVLVMISSLPTVQGALLYNESGAVMSYNLNYSENGKFSYKNGGTWRKYELNEANEDSRIAEYWPETDLWIDERESDEITKQILLRPFKNVVIFYKDKKPVVGTSIKNEEGVVTEKLESENEVLEYLDQNITENKIETLNSLPLMILSDSYARKTEKLNSALKELREMLDGPTLNDPQEKEFYIPSANRFYPEMDNQTKNKLLTSIVKSLVTNVYYAGFENNETDKANPEQISPFVMKVLQKISKEGSANVGHLVNSLTYFTMKTLRYYFVWSSVHFFDDLFKSYKKGTSTLTTLLDSFEESADAQRIMRNYFFKKLEPELIFDANNRDALSMEDAMQGPNHIEEVKGNMISAFKAFYQENLTDLREFVPNAPDDIISLDDDIIFDHGIEIIRRDLFKMYFDVMFSMVKEYLPKLPCFLDQGFTDLSNSTDQLSEMRKYMRVLGLIKFDEEIDSSDVSFINLDVFGEMRRQLLI